MKRYEIAAHTADAVLKAWGDTREALFRHAALGLFEILVPPDSRDTGKGLSVAHTVDLCAPSLEDLLVDWLNELLYIFERDGAVFEEMDIDLVDEGSGLRLKALIIGEGGGRGGAEVKAATYHGLKVMKERGGWHAYVTLDR